MTPASAKSPAKSLMVVGTSSHVGKSLVVTALCRLLSRQGWRVAPFKAQNMSLNAYVTAEGGEIAYAQALQAWAAGIEPTVLLNPILLKPQGQMTSQVILNGRVAGTYRAGDYYEQFFAQGWQAVTDALTQLRDPYDWLIIEGAGSPAEINLRHRDLTNMRVACHLNAPTWLVADIDRGGALAHVVGTLQLLLPEERRLIQGILINKFRGVRELLQPGLDWLADYTQVPIVGVLPWLDFALPQEDSLSLIEPRREHFDSGDSKRLQIVVIHLPHIANFTDFDPLLAEPSVHLRFVKPGDLGSGDLWRGADVLILPGSKTTMADLAALRGSGFPQRLAQFSGEIIGICGGLQMLASRIGDPDGWEGAPGWVGGLGLLAGETVLEANKVTRQVTTQSIWPEVAPIQGYEIHQGRSTFAHSLFPLFSSPQLGVRSRDGRIWGTYLHGLFDNHLWRRQWLNRLRHQKGWDPLPLLEGHYSQQRTALLDRLADCWEPHLDLQLWRS
ncbi:MAG: cobyric acid synthase [Cyanobacteriota bacterium]|nr:cobyric acid synthase [Cyanobacteriota bacterium]